MKHVFVVHSHISYLCAIGVIKFEKLSVDNVIIISDGYNIVGPWPITQIDVTINQKLLIHPIVFLNVLGNASHYLDKVLENFTKGEYFIGYVSVFHHLKRLVVTNPLCKEFHFIEEGLSAYYEEFTIEDYSSLISGNWRYNRGIKGFKQRVLSALNSFSFRIDKLSSIPLFYHPYIYNKNRKFYCFSEYAYKFASNRNIIDFDTCKNTFDEKKSENLDFSLIWIGDPDIENIYSESIYYNSLYTFLIPFLKNNNFDTLYVRFHYRESKKQRQKFIKFLGDNNIKYKIIPDQKIMEFVLLDSHSCTVIGYMSTLLLYAALFGHSSYSIMRSIPELANNVNLKIPFFSKIVSII